MSDKKVYYNVVLGDGYYVEEFEEYGLVPNCVKLTSDKDSAQKMKLRTALDVAGKIDGSVSRVEEYTDKLHDLFKYPEKTVEYLTDGKIEVSRMDISEREDILNHLRKKQLITKEDIFEETYYDDEYESSDDGYTLLVTIFKVKDTLIGKDRYFEHTKEETIYKPSTTFREIFPQPE